MSTAAEIALAFSAKPSGSGWVAHCPLHDDTTELMSIGEGNTGKVLLHCFAGCAQDALIAEVRRRGYEPDGILGSKPRAQQNTRAAKKPPKGSNWLIQIGRPEPKEEPSPEEPPPDKLDDEESPDEEPDEESLDEEEPSEDEEKPEESDEEPTEEVSSLPRPAKCDLAAYAKKLNLHVDHLKAEGLTDSKFFGAPAIRIPYVDESGMEVATRYRIRLSAADRFRWNKGAKPCLFGLSRIAEAREKGAITIVEGESDCLTLWFENFDTVGLPGANLWREERDARHFDGFGKIFVVIEPDAGGEAVLRWLAELSIRERAHLIWMPESIKDPAALYQSNPGAFYEAWPALLADAQPWQEYADESNLEARTAAKAKAARLLSHPNVLEEVVKSCRQRGVVHESSLIQLTYLVGTTRILDRVVSMIVKGVSSAGKSYVVGVTMGMFPPDAYHAWTTVSEHSLIYSNDSYSHKMLVFYEAAGISGDFLTYVIRSLLSENRIVHETTEKVGGKLQSRRIVKEGPTGLILTTTKLAIDAETETRCISITATDTPQQTAAIMRKQAARDNEMAPEHDLSEFHALQSYLALERSKVVIPFGPALARLIKPVAVRLRRDHETLRSLIMAHTLLHQTNRERNENGALIAQYVDYERVSELMNGLISDAAGITVPQTVRETREAVFTPLTSAKANDDEPEESQAPKAVSMREMAHALKLDRSTAYRRVQDAIKRGYLKNLEEKKGRQARIALGDPIEADEGLLPSVETIKTEMERLAKQKMGRKP